MADDTKTSTSSKSSDSGQAEVQDSFTQAQEQGYFGRKVDPEPNSAHSLESGPDAPPVARQPESHPKAGS